MNIKIANLDYRAGSAAYDPQTTQINNFLATKTLVKAIVTDELVCAAYTDTVPANPSKVKVFEFETSVNDNGIPATETTMETFLNTKTVTDILVAEDGILVVVYHD